MIWLTLSKLLGAVREIDQHIRISNILKDKWTMDQSNHRTKHCGNKHLTQVLSKLAWLQFNQMDQKFLVLIHILFWRGVLTDLISLPIWPIEN